MLLILFTLIHLHADSSCGLFIRKDGRVLPVVEVPEYKHWLSIGAELNTRYDWPALFNRRLRVISRDSETSAVASEQMLYPVTELVKKHPAIADVVTEMNAIWDLQNKKLRKSRKYRRDLAGASFVELRKHLIFFGRTYPGEFGQVVIALPKLHLKSKRLSGWEQNAGRPEYERLLSLQPKDLFNDVQASLEKAGVELYEGARVHVYFVHNHPGAVVPLSSGDIRTQNRIATVWAAAAEDVDFIFTAVALGTWRETGDVGFVRSLHLNRL